MLIPRRLPLIRCAVRFSILIALVACGTVPGTQPVVPFSPLRESIKAPPGTSGYTALKGILFDSLVQIDTLRGALIQLEGRASIVSSDQRGHFHFDSVERGVQRLIVRHPVLDSLGIGALPLPILVTSGDQGIVALPSAEAYYASLCRSPKGSMLEGAVIGTVRRAEDDSPIPNVEVAGFWRTADSSYAGARSRPRSRSRTDSVGHFVLCNVPRFQPVEVGAGMSTESERIRVQLGDRTLAAHDLTFETPDSLRRVGSASSVRLAVQPGTVHGRIVNPDGEGIPDVLVAFDRPVLRVRTDSEGRFAMPNVPPGIRTLEVRAIGYQPMRLGLSVRSGHEESQTITIDRRVAVLGAVTVRADRFTTWDSSGFEERRRRGSGYFLTAEDLNGVVDLSTALRMVPGLRGRSNDRTQRLIAGRGAGCLPAFVVNQVLFAPGGSIGPEAMIRASDIRAMEVFTSRLATPPQYQRYSDCAVIVIWLRDPQREIEAKARR
ncbi:MAG: carboxypeptidase regulatory-like domain-containing protein [Gemmatimonadaceae bacterium]|nr:carboxypeptidase regulatory-like domain-containing protein [Gemmatimonadaceae bacterium]